MRKSLLLFIILILLTGCGQTATLSTAQNDKIQALKDQIAVLKQEQTEQRNTILALKVKLGVYESHSGIPDFSEFNELFLVSL